MRNRDRLVAVILGIVLTLVLAWIVIDSLSDMADRMSRNEALEAQRKEAAIIQEIPERGRPSKED